jgi:hypothetical protein
VKKNAISSSSESICRTIITSICLLDKVVLGFDFLDCRVHTLISKEKGFLHHEHSDALPFPQDVKKQMFSSA